MDYCFPDTFNDGTYIDQLSPVSTNKKKNALQLALHIKIASKIFPDTQKEEIIYSGIKLYKKNSRRSWAIQLGKLHRELVKKLVDRYVSELFNKRKIPTLSTDKFFSLHTPIKTNVITTEVSKMFEIALSETKPFCSKTFLRKESIMIIEFIRSAFNEYAKSRYKEAGPDSSEINSSKYADLIPIDVSHVVHVLEYIDSKIEYIKKILEKRIMNKKQKDIIIVAEPFQDKAGQEKKDNRVALPVDTNQQKEDIPSRGSLLKIMTAGFIHTGVNNV